MIPKIVNYRNKYPTRGQITVEDKIIDIPSIYSGTGLTSFFPIDYRKARTLINSKNIFPARFGLNKAILTITVFDFIDSPVGPYKELVYSIPVLYKPIINLPFVPLLLNKFYKNFGVYVVDIMQSTRIAIDHGNVLTGYPHNPEIISIETNKMNETVSVIVKSGNEMILEMNFKPKINYSSGRNISQSYFTFFEKSDKKTYKIMMDIYGIEVVGKSSSLAFAQNKLTKVLSELAIDNHSLMSLYYPSVTEINPVSLEEI
ncbi:MAG: acetoacetate decarboxylase family protein [Patescibacteria group bacterium]|nr:acetoacetate decarboxylase family protein [Patescibacteria group bacterium]